LCQCRAKKEHRGPLKDSKEPLIDTDAKSFDSLELEMLEREEKLQDYLDDQLELYDKIIKKYAGKEPCFDKKKKIDVNEAANRFTSIRHKAKSISLLPEEFKNESMDKL
jgi:hypothetical protein